MTNPPAASKSGFPSIKPLSPVPRLLIELEPAHKVFVGNLRDFLLPDKGTTVSASSSPGIFWADVFVVARTPWKSFGQSLFAHALVAAIFLTAFKFAPPPHVLERTPFDHSRVIYFSPSEYLPPLDTLVPDSPTPQAENGSPRNAPQTIISVPPESDNRAQTVVTAPAVRSSNPLPLPNMVSWAAENPVIPAALTEREITGLKAQPQKPPVMTAVVAPAPQMNAAPRQMTSGLADAVVVAPQPTMESASFRNLGQSPAVTADVVEPSPQLNTLEHSQNSRPSPSDSNSAVAPPPSLSATPSRDQSRNLIALNATPVAPTDAQIIPGNRRGSFAATPQGDSAASGAPAAEVREKSAGSSTDTNRRDIPSGLLIGAESKAVASQPVANDSASSASEKSVIAKAIPPRVTALPTETLSPRSANETTQAERTIFGARKFYSMTLNMPNLNSAGGSWVIRFAELKQNQQVGPLVAPVALQEVDPGYPAELIRHNIAGTVTLYAVIHRDGSVGEVRILVSADDRLDEYARNALLRWRFAPATKNGSAVDLEAVVMIPFKPARTKSAF